MKVLQLISSCGYYGAEAMLITLAEALREAGIDVRIGLVETPTPGFHEMAEIVRARNLPLYTIPCHGKWDRRAIRKIKEIIEIEGIHVLHGHGYKSDFYGLLGGRKTPVKYVATCHDSGLAKPVRWSQGTATDVYGALHKLVFRRFDKVIAVSQPIADALVRSGLQVERVSAIDNGIPLRRFTVTRSAEDLVAFKGNAALVGLIGRLAEGKGHRTLLDAAKLMSAKQNLVKFAFIGDGPLEDELRRATSELGLQERVLFAGKRNDMPAVYAALDVFALPSDNEGMPISILEAMASKTPVIATRVGAIPSVVEDGQTGILIDPGDIDALVSAISRVLSSTESRSQMVERAYKFVWEQYSAESMASKYIELYKEILPDFAKAPDLTTIAQ